MGPRDTEPHDHETYESKGERPGAEPKSCLESFEGGARDTDADPDLNVN